MAAPRAQKPPMNPGLGIMALAPAPRSGYCRAPPARSFLRRFRRELSGSICSLLSPDSVLIEGTEASRCTFISPGNCRCVFWTRAVGAFRLWDRWNVAWLVFVIPLGWAWSCYYEVRDTNNAVNEGSGRPREPTNSTRLKRAMTRCTLLSYRDTFCL